MTPADQTAKVELSGDLDFNRAKTLYDELCAHQDAPRVLIDCSGATFLDSTVLTAFMRFRRRYIEAGGDPVDIVVVVPPHLRRIFEITGLTSTMTVLTAGPEAGPESRR